MEVSVTDACRLYDQQESADISAALASQESPLIVLQVDLDWTEFAGAE